MAKRNKYIVEIQIPSELGYEKVVMSTGASLAYRMGFSPDQVEDVKTALSEACTNAIEHGNASNPYADVLVIFTAAPGNLMVNVIDHGQKPIPQTLPDRSTRPDFRGWGLYLIQNLMDHVEIKSQPGRNELQMTYQRTPSSLTL
jgi:serine/threonine-protein kinase RsbW